MSHARKVIRMWRVSRAEPKGLHLWFDPETEFPRLYELLPSDGSVAPEVPDDVVDRREEMYYLDKVASVSGLEDEDEADPREETEVQLYWR